MPGVSVSTWSLHRQLGRAWYVQTDDGLQNRSEATDGIALMAVPAMVAAHGIHHLEVCHFHFPSTDPGYLHAFRDELDRNDVTFHTLLIDTADITHPDPEQNDRELRTVEAWIDVAAQCGAKQARVVAGEAAPSQEAIDLSAKNLGKMARYAHARGLGIATENFKKLTQRAGPLLQILDRCADDIGLCADFGNFKGDTKFDDLAAVLPRATTIHAKGGYVGGKLDELDFLRCMSLSKASGFDGHYVLIFSDEGEEWPYLDALKQEVDGFL
ncbi:MAG: TIM barrel protein [bacterium]|nr:TIM barrel protein [bacterium]